MFSGENYHTLDEKGRIAIPAMFRQFATSVEGNEVWYLTRGFEPCLMLFTAEAWRRILAQLEHLTLGNKDHRTFIRHFVGPAVEVQADKQGRISLPQHLREYAGITREVASVGAMRYVEIWDRANFLSEQSAAGDMSSIGETLGGLKF